MSVDRGRPEVAVGTDDPSARSARMHEPLWRRFDSHTAKTPPITATHQGSIVYLSREQLPLAGKALQLFDPQPTMTRNFRTKIEGEMVRGRGAPHCWRNRTQVVRAGYGKSGKEF
jgi:hypothetical protein